MSKKRRNFSGKFKTKVALEAIRGELTLTELASKHEVHQSQVAAWKKQAVDGMQGAFSGSPINDEAKHQKEVKELHAKIGQLLVEKDFLSRAFGR